jgi:aspartate/methionine/tyrosine aminotransferase
MTKSAIDYEALISDRALGIDVSGIRRVFELGASLTDPINLSIGQPHFAVPDAMKLAIVQAINDDRHGYTLTQGAPELLEAVGRHLASEVGWITPSDELDHIITSGTSGGIALAFLASLNPGDEVIFADPYFVIYPALADIAGATAVMCDTYPDFRMTAERVEPLITPRTKLLLVNSPGNPSGVVLNNAELRDLVDLCTQRGVLMISDEIYDAFTYSDATEQGVCPTPAQFTQEMLLVRGFGKTFGCTGWRLGWACGPRPVIQQMMKLQQYLYVCAPSVVQYGAAVAYEQVDMSRQIAAYEQRRDMVKDALADVTHLTHPGGAYYAFPEIPAALQCTATEFAETAIGHNLLVIPGGVFSKRDTHVRLSYAVERAKLQEGLGVLRALMQGK